MRDVTKRLQCILLELESFTTARGNHLLKELKCIRKERRKAKDDQAILQSVMHTLKGVKQKVVASGV
ncbi:hypothetical protein [Bacillus hominis]|uniref:hypothetical protein n=1 Tax=Bacillus hominis TaxID=2817478 RepID=UPI001EE5833B|nr:hypothetical protein [Bacillus hominis]